MLQQAKKAVVGPFNALRWSCTPTNVPVGHLGRTEKIHHVKEVCLKTGIKTSLIYAAILLAEVALGLLATGITVAALGGSSALIAGGVALLMGGFAVGLTLAQWGFTEGVIATIYLIATRADPGKIIIFNNGFNVQ